MFKSGEVDSLVVFLHGYGADGADLLGLADPLSEHLPNTVFVAPNAPERCIGNPMGYQWFPIPWIDGSSEEEAEIQNTLAGLMHGKTVIAIAHRLSTIARMDRIVVMDAGRIAEEGTHEQLLARNGLYADFWARQSGGFLGVEAAE